MSENDQRQDDQPSGAIEHDVDARLEDDNGTFDIHSEGSGTAGLPPEEEVPQETLDQLEKEREERLSDENRPDGASIDNSQRTFDEGSGRFTDDPDYDPDDRPFADDDSGAPPPEEAAEDAGAAKADDTPPEDQRTRQDLPAEDVEDDPGSESGSHR